MNSVLRRGDVVITTYAAVRLNQALFLPPRVRFVGSAGSVPQNAKQGRFVSRRCMCILCGRLVVLGVWVVGLAGVYVAVGIRHFG